MITRGMTPHCLSHCAICGQHFRSDRLFDAHMDRTHRTRGCLACRLGVSHEYRHLSKPQAPARQVEGLCDLAGPQIVPARIWTRA